MQRFSGGIFRRLFPVVCVLSATLPSGALAQLAPVAGAHYSARPSDTGFQGSVNAAGGYRTSVPLEFPAPRDDLQVPVHVVYGGNQVGAAGLGWDVPLSFITRSTTTAKRRPAPQPTLAAPVQLSLTLGGESIDLVRNASDTAWVARRGHAQIEVRTNGDGLMVAQDGEGRTYHFSSRGTVAGSRLLDGNLYLLTSIAGPNGNKVLLGYGISAPALAGGGSGLAVNLASVSYNEHPSSPGCFKHKVYLTYDAPVAAPAPPLAYSVLNGGVLTRLQKLTAIVAKSKSTCTDSEKTLSTYSFSYHADADTKQPRLRSVTLAGRQGTPEQNVPLPVATYTYGAVANSSNQIVFERVPDAGPPAAGAAFYDNGISNTSTSFISLDGKQYSQSTNQLLVDRNGDGRPDFSKISNSVQEPDDTFLNFSDVLKPARFVRVNSSAGAHSPPGLFVASQGGQWNYHYPTEKQAVRAVLQTGRKMLDMNGDGLLDTLGSLPAGFWMLGLTKAAADGGLAEDSRSISLDNIENALADSGISSGGEIERTITTQVSPLAACWSRLSTGFVRDSNASCSDFPVKDHLRRSITQFELKDVNGDGYPDFVYVASPIADFDDAQLRPASTESRSPVLTTIASDFLGSRDVRVLLNTAGIHLETDSRTEIFATHPITLEDGSVSGCGISRWEPDPGDPAGGIQNQMCALQDVNGDGIADRVVTQANGTTVAKLGTGDMARPYSGATITLPGVLSRTETALTRLTTDPTTAVPIDCVHQSTFRTFTTRALRDINGDGIPDYLVSSTAMPWQAYLGTGTGYSPPIPVIVPSAAGPALAVESNRCGGYPITHDRMITSSTVSGLYDIDGNGQPDIVVKAADTWNIYQLKAPVAQDDVSSAGVPAAGRLTKIENGYGAATTIGYASAKDDASAAHRVPFPEIVVAAVGVKNASGGVQLSTTRYAYRGAEMIFDPALDRFRFPGYRRTIALNNIEDIVGIPASTGTATITDSYALEPFAAGMDAKTRFARYLKVGLVSDVVTLSGNVGTNPKNLLDVDSEHDARRTAGTHYDWDVRQLESGKAPTGNELCPDMMFPNDYKLSKGNALSATDDVCTHRGFAFKAKSFAWRGTPGTADAITSPNTTQTSTQIRSIDDYGRVTDVRYDNDLTPTRFDDDVCVATTYAVPIDGGRMLNQPARKTSTNCRAAAVRLFEEEFEYDTSADGRKLPPGRIAKGLVTSHIVHRLDATTGDPIDPLRPKIRMFEATYDASAGNLVSVSRAREDGAANTASMSYDAFGLVPTGSQLTGVNADGTAIPVQTTAMTVDPLTLDTLSVTDANGTKRGQTFDGFGRTLLATVTPPGRPEGVLARTNYLGFGVGQTGGRRIESTLFADLVPLSAAGNASGRTATAYLDSLGRASRTDVALGADYAHKTIVVGRRTYDSYGRVLFVADPFEAGQAGDPYGTTYHYYADGSPQCTYRAWGKRHFTSDLDAVGTKTDEASERLVSCRSHRFVENQEQTESTAADARTPGAFQAGTKQVETFSAVGRLLRRQTQVGGIELERMDFSYGATGHLNSTTRHLLEEETSLTTTWRHDSLGQIIALEEPGVGIRHRSYDTWGKLTSERWCDPEVSSCTDAAATSNRGTYHRYDALGRLTHSEDRTNDTAIPQTARDFAYDQGENSIVPPVAASHVLGRLAKATSPTSSVSYGYDAFGRVRAEVLTDRTVAASTRYAQTQDFFDDGSLKALHLLLPDNNYVDEKAEYVYDSAGRLRKATHSDGSRTTSLFAAEGGAAIDVLGRLRQVTFGANAYQADYAEQGRRLIKSVKVSSPMSTSREIRFPTVTAAFSGEIIRGFDAVGRERVRLEYKDGVALPAAVMNQYDELGRLGTNNLFTVATGMKAPQVSQTYDSLGNVSKHTDYAGAGAKTVSLSYDGSDYDRMCSIAFGLAAPDPTCNVKYDAVGNITELPTRANGKRKLSYFPSGLTRTITMGEGATQATFDYDAFGAVQRLVVNGSGSPDSRHDKHFGRFIYQRDERVNGVVMSVNNRSVPGPHGFLATRHGAASSAPWTFAFGERRGNRFFTDQTGAFVQDVDYRPYGEVGSASGEQPGSPRYTSTQWNGRDLLAAVGLSQLGARMYDPVIGRFLSRDPLVMPRTATTTNPYAFAMNDPINRSDPSGLDCIGLECEGPILGETDAPGGPGGGSNGGGGVYSRPGVDYSAGVCSSMLCTNPNFVYRAPSPGVNHVAPDGSVGPVVAGPPNDPCAERKVSCGDPDAVLQMAPKKRAAVPVEPFQRSYDEQIDADLELLGTLSGVPGDALDVAELFMKNSSMVPMFGAVTDFVGGGTAIWKYARNPSVETRMDAFRGVADPFLIAYAPGGIFLKLAVDFRLKYIDPIIPKEKQGAMMDAQMTVLFAPF